MQKKQEINNDLGLVMSGGGSEAAHLIEKIYGRAKALLGPNNRNFSSLVSANILSHQHEYNAEQIANLFVDLVDSATLLKPDRFETLLPQLAAALHQAGRNEEATQAVEQYLAFRNGSRADPSNPAFEKVRLRGALRDLAGWGVEHPKLMQQLKEYRDTLPDATAN